MKRSLRPLWHIVAFYLLCFVALGILEVAVGAVLGPRAVDSREVLFQWLTLASVVLATWIMLRRVEKLPWSTVGLDRAAALPQLIFQGAAWGGLTIGVASLLLFGIHMLRIDPATPGGWWGEAWHSTLVFLPAGFFEELFIRGYVFAVLRRNWGWKMALIVSSVVFGLLHAWNPGADAESILAVTVAGFFLGAIFLATRSLYAAGAAHFAWNWVMSGLLHIAVSGVPSRDPDYRVVETGPDWLTGGPWGPEGGFVAVAAMFVGIFYLYGRYLRRMEWKA
ncbi:MAG TPA: type II CAAX endopeptidase family protein [Gemmatimonadaceae bacterium]|nr:type II CAAX endopeptidase family protein [Gemmatimonadaceae bacterium]